MGQRCTLSSLRSSRRGPDCCWKQSRAKERPRYGRHEGVWTEFYLGIYPVSVIRVFLLGFQLYRPRFVCLRCCFVLFFNVTRNASSSFCLFFSPTFTTPTKLLHYLRYNYKRFNFLSHHPALPSEKSSQCRVGMSRPISI